MMPNLDGTIKRLQDSLKVMNRWCRTDSLDDPIANIERAIEDALELLKAQQKTSVVFKQFDGSIESECGNCGLWLDKTYSVCPKCGKELNWND